MESLWRTFIALSAAAAVLLVVSAPTLLVVGYCFSDNVTVEDWAARLPVVYSVALMILLVNGVAIYPVIRALRASGEATRE